MSAESLPPLDGSSPLKDAAEQCVVHGLLTALYASSPEDRHRRTHGILNYVRSHSVEPNGSAPPAKTALPAALSLRMPEPTGAGRRTTPLGHWLPTVVRRFVLPVGLAATILLAIVQFWRSTPAARADVYTEAVNVGTPMFSLLSNAVILFDDDPQATEAFRQQLVLVKENRDRLLEEFSQPGKQGPEHLIPLMQAWQGLATGLAQRGDRTQAINQLQEALSLLRRDQSVDGAVNWQWILLDDLGNTHAMFGEHDAARQAYTDSVDLRVASGGCPGDPHRGEPGYEGHLSSTVVIPYLRFVMLAVAQDDLAEADRWLARSKRCLAQHLSTICEMNGRSLPADASFWQAWAALPAEFRWPKDEYTPAEAEQWPAAWQVYRPSENYAHLVGAWLYHQAVVSRLKGDTNAAAQALDDAATLEPFLTHRPENDEFRLPLLLHLERARLALLAHRPADALAELDKADAFAAGVQRLYEAIESGQLKGPGVPDAHRLPIGPARREEISLLRGLAQLGLQEADQAKPDSQQTTGFPSPSPSTVSGESDARRRILRALEVPQRLARNWPPADRERFLKQFESWKSLADRQGMHQP